MDMAHLENLIALQQDLFGAISKSVSNLKKKGKDNITVSHVTSRLQTLETNWTKFLDTHTTIYANRTTELAKHDYFVTDLRSLCEEEFIEAKSTFLAAMTRLSAPTELNVSNSSASHASDASSSRTLPRINLPVFSGAYEDWISFRELFTSIVMNNTSLSAVEKFHYLKTNLSGDALQQIGTVTVSADNFKRAWDILLSRYDNKRALVDTHLDLLFSIRRSNHESASEVKRLLGTLTETVTTLQGLGCHTQAWAPILIYWISRRMDVESLKAWETSLGSSTDLPSYRDFERFLIGRVQTLEALERAQRVAPSKPRITSAGTTRSSTDVRSHQTTSSSSCSLCQEPHYISSCPVFLLKSTDQRRDFVSQNNLCFNCLGVHRVNVCRSTRRCRLCQERHHTSIHRNPDAASDTPDPAASDVTGCSPSQGPTSHHAGAPCAAASRPPVLLSTAQVRITSSNGAISVVRCLLDQGAEVSFIRESLVQSLHLQRRSANLPVKGIGERRTTTTRGVVCLQLGSVVDPSFKFIVTAFVLPKLTSYVPDYRDSAVTWAHIASLPLADPDYLSQRRIDLVIGADVYGRLLRPEVIQGLPHTPTAQNTYLGWILSGPTSSLTASAPPSAAVGLHGAIDDGLDALLRRFWALDEPTPRSAHLSSAEIECEQHFDRTHSRDSSGRYTVRLPVARDLSALGDSRTGALRTLMQTERRFASKPELKSAYCTFLQEYQRLGHMRLASESEDPGKPAFYLPHHIVMRDAATAKKARVVFNGSQASSSGLSLNDCLLVGPKLQTELADVILRWRRHAIAFAADIEQMYRQISVHADDQSLQQIFWRENPETPVLTFKLTTVTYGLACAPYLALKTLHQLTHDEGHRFPTAIDIASFDMYVDDVLSGADDTPSCLEKIRDITGLLHSGGFKLKKWIASDDTILSSLPADQLLESSLWPFDAEPTHRTLGLTWNPRRDSFSFTVQADPTDSTPTKRSTLSQISKLFDPLGWLAPIIIRAKLFMQEIWSLRGDWDDPLPADFCQRWALFRTQLSDIRHITIPRWLGTLSTNAPSEIHGFADASSTAMGLAIYLRVLSDDQTARVTLLTAKTKVAPLKPVTIPRLELSAALMLTRHITQTRRVLQLASSPVHLWTDSTVTLAWIRSDPNRWKEFVKNRVAEIQGNLPNASWHHVRSQDNPADLASRGVTPAELTRNSLWWTGPVWLKQHSSTWPALTPPTDSTVDTEARHSVRAPLSLLSSLPSDFDLASRFSSLIKLLRITSWCFRAIDKLRHRPSVDHATITIAPSELEKSRLFWVRQTQHEHFSTEHHNLTSKIPLKTSSALLKLLPFVDNIGLIRVGGRLKHSLLNPDHKHPFVLPKASPFTTLVIQQAHALTLHGGPQATLAYIRRSYWILGGRSPVRSFISRCVICIRQRARTCEQQMGQLPPRRVLPSRPFLHSGVDYAGPISLRTIRGRGAKFYKGYIAIFVCFATSAIHIELVTDYTTDAFIAAYKRFCSRRGICATLTSDCGTNFLGADSELRRSASAAARETSILASSLATSGTQWRFNPPSAPHFGGKWEAAVKSVKYHLRRIIGDTVLTFEEYSTLLAQIEAALNSRPLCPINDDVTDLNVLTPGHFLTGNALNAVPEPDLRHIPLPRLSRWQLVQHMFQHFWHRWSVEYLHQLHVANKWRRSHDEIKIGSIVLIKDERFPPTKWPLARVLEVHPGPDNLTRVVTLRTSSTTLKRPIVKVCPLSITAEQD